MSHSTNNYNNTDIGSEAMNYAAGCCTCSCSTCTSSASTAIETKE